MYIYTSIFLNNIKKMENDQSYTLVVGKIQYIDIETGYWSLNDGENKYRINNMPEELKKEGLKIAAMIKKNLEEMSVFMSGISANLIDYKILN
jgi:hypothetical protein